MLKYPNIDPIAFHIGPLPVHWYGLMYLVGFFAAWWLLSKRAVRLGFSKEQISDLIFYGALGVIIGGRVGYMLFYNFPALLKAPWSLFMLWQGGMSFHGGLLGVTVAMWVFGHKNNCSLVTLTDFIAPVVPIGLGAGRLGNFINGELWGRVTEVPWGMVYPAVGSQPRHPSELYEFLLEGVVLFLVLWCFSKTPKPSWVTSGLFLTLYGIFRFSVEFFRQPDAGMGFVVGDWMSMGQVLSLPMMVLGVGCIIWGIKRGIVDEAVS